MRIAIIGTGISGLTAGYLLNRHHEITLFESNDRIGGHTATEQVTVDDQKFNVDTGFIVYNDWTYPNFIQLMSRLDVATQPAPMGFSVFDPCSNFEYAGDNLNTLFSDRRLLFSGRHWQMLWDIMRFNRQVGGNVDTHWPAGLTLGQFLKQEQYGDSFIQRYLTPMAAAIWSSSTADVLQLPLLFFADFFRNHGLLNVADRPQWRVIKGGSGQYIPKLTKDFAHRIRVATPVRSVRRNASQVVISTDGGEERFDAVVLACHSDQALRLLADPDKLEADVLGAIGYRDNEVVLHTDISWLPKRRRTWSSWNYRLSGDMAQPPIVTYNMNQLQGIQSPVTFCVTLNAGSGIAARSVLKRYTYSHPVFSDAAIIAQNRWAEINGQRNTWFCGAYWFNGFHEDGVNSAIRVARHLGADAL